MARTQGSARQEAERLVATVLAMAAQGGGHRPSGGLGVLGDVVSGLLGQAAGRAPGAGHSGRDDRGRDDHSRDGRSGRGDGTPVGNAWATGSAECCVCPICRVIAGMRDPSPETAERLATGAGDFATGVASLLRAFSTVTGESTATGDRASRPAGGAERGDNVGVVPTGAPSGTGDSEPSAVAGERRTGEDAWAAATATTGDPTATVPRRRRPAAKPDAESGPAAEQDPGSGPAAWVRAGTAARGDDPWAAATAPVAARQESDRRGVDHGAAGHDGHRGDEARSGGVV